jgi:hypothetical protein
VKLVRLLTIAALVAAAAWMATPRVAARQAAPGAPAHLKYLVNNANVYLEWTHAPGPFTHYNIEAAPAPGAVPFLIFPTSLFAQPGNVFSKLPERLATFSAGPIGGGTYYVRIRAVNGTAVGPASNEIALPVTGACQAPGAPTNFGSIIRGSFGLFQWNAGNGGRPATYIVQASFGPNDPNPPVQIPLGTPYFTIGIPAGTFYVRVVAANACGTSLPSNEIVVTSPSNTPAITPNPPPGERLPQPFVRDLVFQFAAQARNLGYLNPQTACPTRAPGTFNPAYELEARKTQRNAYIDYIVRNLRTFDQRFGFNAKPTRAVVPSIIAGDEIAYHYGSDAPEGSPNVYIVDALGGHCTGVGVVGGVDSGPDRHTPDYRVFYDEFGRWTLAGLTP